MANDDETSAGDPRWRIAELSEARFRAVFEHTAAGIAIEDVGGSAIETNPALQRMLGRAADELRGRRLRDFVHPDDTVDEDALRGELLGGRRAAYQVEQRIRRPDGDTLRVRVTVTLVRDEAGAPRFAVTMVDDLTARRSAEDALRQAQKMDALGQLAGGIAHDFNNLLTVIRGNVGFARLELPPASPALADLLEAERAAQRAAELVRQLLAFGRRQPGATRAVDPREVLEGAERMLRRLLPPTVLLQVLTAADLGLVDVDAAQLEQVLLNLVVNARDAMPDGGTVAVELANRTIGAAPADMPPGRTGVAPTTLPAGDYVVIAVRDSGTGMDEATRRRAFEPFFTTKPPGRGTGLGLATVLGIVAQSGGAVALDSAPGRGTVVSIWLPRATAPGGMAGRAAAAVATTSRPERPTTILVVEDESAVRHWVARLLAYHGYRVLEARHGADALLVLESEGGTVDLVLADVVMPELDGWALAERVRARGSGTPVVLMTGYPFGQPPGAARGVLPLLEKPLDAATLLDVVARSLRGARGDTARPSEPPARGDAPPARDDVDRGPRPPRPPHTDP